MKTIKHITLSVLASIAIISFSACERIRDLNETGPEMMLKSGGSYISTNSTVSAGDEVVIGIEAEVREEKILLVKFNITKVVNGGSQEEVYTQDLSSDSFDYDYNFTVEDSQKGNTEIYTFTVTNRDGLIAQQSVALTINE